MPKHILHPVLKKTVPSKLQPIKTTFKRSSAYSKSLEQERSLFSISESSNDLLDIFQVGSDSRLQRLEQSLCVVQQQALTSNNSHAKPSEVVTL